MQDNPAQIPQPLALATYKQSNVHSKQITPLNLLGTAAHSELLTNLHQVLDQAPASLVGQPLQPAPTQISPTPAPPLSLSVFPPPPIDLNTPYVTSSHPFNLDTPYSTSNHVQWLLAGMLMTPPPVVSSNLPSQQQPETWELFREKEAM